MARRIAQRFKQRGLGPDDDPCGADPLAEEESWFAALAAASVQGRIAIGPQAGQRLLKLGDRVDPEDLPARSQPLCANIAGLGLHAGVALPARDRQRLERLCRYATPVGLPRPCWPIRAPDQHGAGRTPPAPWPRRAWDRAAARVQRHDSNSARSRLRFPRGSSTARRACGLGSRSVCRSGFLRARR